MIFIVAGIRLRERDIDGEATVGAGSGGDRGAMNTGDRTVCP